MRNWLHDGLVMQNWKQVHECPCIFIIQNKFATDDDKGKIFRIYMLDVANDFLVLLMWQAAAWIGELPVCKG